MFGYAFSDEANEAYARSFIGRQEVQIVNITKQKNLVLNGQRCYVFNRERGILGRFLVELSDGTVRLLRAQNLLFDDFHPVIPVLTGEKLTMLGLAATFQRVLDQYKQGFWRSPRSHEVARLGFLEKALNDNELPPLLTCSDLYVPEHLWTPPQRLHMWHRNACVGDGTVDFRRFNTIDPKKHLVMTPEWLYMVVFDFVISGLCEMCQIVTQVKYHPPPRTVSEHGPTE